MNFIHFTGNLGSDAESRNTTSGDVCSFSVAVRQGTSRDAETQWYRCTIWGQRGQQLMTHLKKGAKVAVAGEFSIGEYQGKPEYKVRVSDIDPFCGGNRPAGGQTEQRRSTSAASGGLDADLEDEVPF